MHYASTSQQCLSVDLPNQDRSLNLLFSKTSFEAVTPPFSSLALILLAALVSRLVRRNLYLVRLFWSMRILRAISRGAGSWWRNELAYTVLSVKDSRAEKEMAWKEPCR